jgi:hypothetical protein
MISFNVSMTTIVTRYASKQVASQSMIDISCNRLIDRSGRTTCVKLYRHDQSNSDDDNKPNDDQALSESINSRALVNRSMQ